MRCLLAERRISETDWPTLVQEVTFTCNSYINASTGYSPHEVMHGARLRSKADCVFPVERPSDFSDVQSYCQHAEEARKMIDRNVWENILGSQQRMERNYIQGTKNSEIESSDWVWLKDEARSSCLSPMFKGPWVVIEKRGVNLQISDLNGGQTHVVYLNRCKKTSRSLAAPDDISTVDTGEITVGKGTSVGDATRTPVSEPLTVDPLSNDSDEIPIGEELHSEEAKGASGKSRSSER